MPEVSSTIKGKLENKENRQVLPTSVRPSHYHLTLTPDLEAFTFNGEVIIDINFKETTNKVVLNTNEIEIQSATLNTTQGKTEQNIIADEITYNTKVTTATLVFGQEIPAGTDAKLIIHFTGILNDKMNGFYRSSYKDQEGNKKYMATTQFEATDARKAFPCWDEPAVKATFDIVLRVPNELVALSNMDVAEENKIADSNLKEVRFNTTPIMSTYLLAFIVGDLDYIEEFTSGKVTGSPVRCRVYAPKGLSEQGRFSLDVCTKTLDLFDEVFGTPYPLPKMDMVAIPDFDAGAMENWGLVTYRTVLLLFDPKSSSTKAKQRIASVVAHELAHQWFGNLVTMEWWSDLWLNEGFATWVGNYAVDKLFPEWDFWTSFVVEDYESGLTLDAMRSSHPIEVEVKDPAEISQIFDAISYKKGASVIRMLNAYLTEDVFLSGIRSYLNKHKYGNASTSDLWAALSDESGQDVSKFMTIWTKQVGYPVLKLTEEEGVDGGKSLVVHQSRYLSSGDLKPEEDEAIWWVPITMITSEANLKPSADVLTTKEASFPIPSNGFYKLNFDTSSLFRVHYPQSAIQNLGLLIAQRDILSARDRIGVVSDTAALAKSGIGSSVDFLQLLQYFKEEDNYLVWNLLSSHMGSILSVWFEEPETVRNSLKKVRRSLFSEVIERLGWEATEGESDLDGMLRALAIRTAGLSEDEQVIEEAKRRFKLFIKGDESAIHPELRSPVYSIVVSEGGADEFESVKKLYLETQTPDQKLSALAALGFTRQPELIASLLSFIINTDNVRSQDIIYPVSSLGANPLSRRESWSFIKSHWGLLAERYGTNFAILGNLVKYTASSLTLETDAQDVENFFDGKDTANIQRPLSQTLENIRSNAAWLTRDRTPVGNWLNSN